MKQPRYAEEQFPCLVKPMLTKTDKDVLISYCSEMGYILDINDELGNALIKTKDNKKVFIQKDYWGNLWAVKNRFTPKQEWENITENMCILEGVRPRVSKKFFDNKLKAIFSILAFNSTFNIMSNELR